MNRRLYLGRCIECNYALYWNEQEERLETSSDLPDHQCRLSTDDDTFEYERRPE